MRTKAFGRTTSFKNKGAGGIRESRGVENNLEIDTLARFAIDEHNKKQFVVATFDGAPTTDSESYNKMEKSVHDAHESQAIMKSFVASTSGSAKPDKFLAYMVPSVGEFLATVSHEIKTSMNGILGMFALLLDTKLSSTQRVYAQTAQACGRALITLINEVLDRAKIEAEKLELESVPFDLCSILDYDLSLFSEKSRHKGIEES